ncbi:hypothetical protein EAF04_002867 [Stromatinia cepivora]|nr:hypothetical protein EAF04_002867 [Stromatinia cepivora]
MQLLPASKTLHHASLRLCNPVSPYRLTTTLNRSNQARLHAQKILRPYLCPPSTRHPLPNFARIPPSLSPKNSSSKNSTTKAFSSFVADAGARRSSKTRMITVGSQDLSCTKRVKRAEYYSICNGSNFPSRIIIFTCSYDYYESKGCSEEWGMSYCSVAEKGKLDALVSSRDVWGEFIDTKCAVSVLMSLIKRLTVKVQSNVELNLNLDPIKQPTTTFNTNVDAEAISNTTPIYTNVPIPPIISPKTGDNWNISMVPEKMFDTGKTLGLLESRWMCRKILTGMHGMKLL